MASVNIQILWIFNYCLVRVYAQQSDVVKVVNGRRSQMADGHLGLGSNVQLGLVDFKVCDWPPETSLNGQSQTLKCSWPIKTSLGWLITKRKYPQDQVGCLSLGLNGRS